jgi:tetratricopeptide (TPR) repeat protein
VYYRRGAYQRAEELFQRALQIREDALGTNHPDVAQTRASLAYLFTTLGKFNEAEEYYKVHSCRVSAYVRTVY